MGYRHTGLVPTVKPKVLCPKDQFQRGLKKILVLNQVYLKKDKLFMVR